MNIKRIIKEEVDSFDWIRDIKTNDTIAKEIYDTLKWHKVPDVTTDFIRVPWADIVFAVKKRTISDSKIPLITPNIFHESFTKYLGENYGLFFTPDIRNIYDKIKELMGDKIHGTITESDDLQWIKDIKPIPELKVGTCFQEGKAEWIITDFKKTPSGTDIVVVRNKKNMNVKKYKHEGYFEEDLLSGKYKPC